MFSGTGIVAAVSGGPDSIALLDILLRLVALAAVHRSPCSIHIAHLDHMLRPRESADDAEFVRGLGEKLGIRTTVSAIDVRAAAKAAGRGIEEVAREIRYTFLTAVARESGFDRIAVGHTMSDQAETVLMRLIRGAGLKGLAAMRPVSPALVFTKSRGGEDLETGYGDKVAASPSRSASPSPLLIRPLLCVTREEIEAYCRERQLEFRTDTTNSSWDYTRNRIRNEIFPALSGINPQVVQAIARAAENVASDQDALDTLACLALREARRDRDANAYSVTSLLEQPVGVRRRAIIEAIRLSRPEDGAEVTSPHVSAVEALLESTQSGKHVSLPGFLEAWREFDGLVFKPSRGSGDAPAQCAISAGRPGVEAGGLTITLERGVPGCELNAVIAESRQMRQRSSRDWMVVALDDQLLPEHLLIGPRMKGERAHVVGQRKTKKLKNLMIDHRIPSSRRSDWPVVTTPDGGYIWSPGLPPSLKLGATDETKSLAILRASFI